jgi:hypothetical protein
MTAFESKGDPYHRKLYEDAEAEARTAEKTAREADAAALIAERNVTDGYVELREFATLAWAAADAANDVSQAAWNAWHSSLEEGKI